jgi:hypothetical protein
MKCFIFSCLIVLVMGKKNTRPLLNRQQLNQSRPNLPNGQSWRFDKWAESGGDRWQGGTLKGLESKLDYLKPTRGNNNLDRTQSFSNGVT